MSNPLDLPEILGLIASYLSIKDIRTCVRVQKSWRSTFEPLLWHTFIYPSSTKQKPKLVLVRQNAEHIRSLVIDRTEPTYLATVFRSCRQLEEIIVRCHFSELGRPSAAKDTMWSCFQEMVRENRNLRAIVLERTSDFGYRPLPRHRLLQALQACSKLEVLQTAECQFNSNLSQSYFQAISPNVKRLSSVLDSFQGFKVPRNLVFPNVRHLDLRNAKMPSRTQLFWIGCFPNLESLTWELDRSVPTTRFCQLLSGCSQLKALGLVIPNGADAMTEALAVAPPLERLLLGGSGFKFPSFQTLKRHALTVKEIDLQYLWNVTSALVQEILCLCPNLESITAEDLNYRDIVKGPWACRNLRKFDVGISVDRGSMNAEQLHTLNQYVYRRLAELKNLQCLSICNNGCGWEGSVYSLNRMMKVSSNAGFEQLQALKDLRLFSCKLAFDETLIIDEGEQLVQWMINHWKRLEVVEITLKVSNHDYANLNPMRRKLRRMLRARDIQVIDSKKSAEYTCDFAGDFEDDNIEVRM
ncbi:hypothetical protein BC939DRAFT_449377 [Gamsiella multidivaricata]|uniref:uncharacterized protein n=1 Tax=Gamsiella multidivaricata TaxID=101098 RepID=UPI0022204950|nr:uncharacterized protein BC939DRAFT_449377 [Gamsiella multidivaricata]KAG0363317.1 hypothetical protein BGZ54_008207 [Gamsiella multidivaricata]KAI7824842.1 hypothetical protein BC939DRAFT_449377 [Gamsiella multidivaricata]